MHLKPELCAAILESPRVYRWNNITEYRSAFISKPSTYFELLSPKTWNGEPHVVMISGGVHSSACYLVTPDGRPGWAHAFLREGYKVVLVDCWATWCGPCVAEMPNVLSVYEKYHDRGFEVIGITFENAGLLDEVALAFAEIPQELHVECDLGVGSVLADPQRLEQVELPQQQAHRRGLPTGNHQRVDGVQLGPAPHRDGLGARLGQRRQMFSGITLQRKDSDARAHSRLGMKSRW